MMANQWKGFAFLGKENVLPGGTLLRPLSIPLSSGSTEVIMMMDLVIESGGYILDQRDHIYLPILKGSVFLSLSTPLLYKTQGNKSYTVFAFFLHYRVKFRILF